MLILTDVFVGMDQPAKKGKMIKIGKIMCNLTSEMDNMRMKMVNS